MRWDRAFVSATSISKHALGRPTRHQTGLGTRWSGRPLTAGVYHHVGGPVVAEALLIQSLGGVTVGQMRRSRPYSWSPLVLRGPRKETARRGASQTSNSRLLVLAIDWFSDPCRRYEGLAVAVAPAIDDVVAEERVG